MWTIEASGPQAWEALSGGSLAAQADQVLLFNDVGLYRLNSDEGSSVLLSDWPIDSLQASDVLSLEQGGALVIHFNRSERRLIRFGDSGDIIWQRSLPEEIPGAPKLVAINGRAYLVAESVADNIGVVSIYGIDEDEATLTHLFEGGTRTPRALLTNFLVAGDDRLLLKIGGGHLVSLDLKKAAESVAELPGPLPE